MPTNILPATSSVPSGPIGVSVPPMKVPDQVVPKAATPPKLPTLRKLKQPLL